MDTASVTNEEIPTIRIPDTAELTLDLKTATSNWGALAAFFKFEPYIERIASHFPEKKIVLHYDVGDLSLNLQTLMNKYPFVHEFVKTNELSEIPMSLNKLLEANLLARPVRSTPCVGAQDWFTTTPRNKSLVVAVDLSTYDFSKLEDEFKNVTEVTFIDTTPASDGDPRFGVNCLVIRNADMVVTDNAAVAMVAAAFSVNKITCLTMFEDAGMLLENIPDIKIFHRRAATVESQYGQMFDFVKREWAGYARYPRLLNVGNAQAFIQNVAMKYCRGYGLDVGSNKWPFYGAIASDVDSRQFDKGPFDFIFSSHCLEHIKGWQDELRLWKKSLKQDGIAFIYVPHPLMEMWLPEGPWVRGGWHVHSPDPIPLVQFLREELNMEILEYTTRPDAYWSFHVVCRKKYG